MCFELISFVEEVENPEITETFTVHLCDKGHPAESYQHHAAVAARLFIQNKVVEAALIEAEKYETVKIAVEEIVDKADERVVVIHSPIILHNLDENVFHPEIRYAANNVKLLGRAIVLQLKDFGFIAQCSMSFAEEADLPEGVAALGTLKLKINVDSESGVVYQHDVI